MADGGVKSGVKSEGPDIGGAPGMRPPAVVELRAADLTGNGVFFCPNPKMPLWSTHPKVFLDVGSTREGRCPYCGTVYRLLPGETVGTGH